MPSEPGCCCARAPVEAASTAAPTSTGSAALTSVAVADKSLALPGHEYGIRFGAGGTSYEVFDKTLDQAMDIKNTQIAEELALPPVKIHCSILAEDAIKAAVADYKKKQGG